MNLWSHRFSQNMNCEKLSGFLPYSVLHYTGQKSWQSFVHILGETMTSFFHSEIYWPSADFILQIKINFQKSAEKMKNLRMQYCIIYNAVHYSFFWSKLRRKKNQYYIIYCLIYNAVHLKRRKTNLVSNLFAPLIIIYYVMPFLYAYSLKIKSKHYLIIGWPLCAYIFTFSFLEKKYRFPYYRRVNSGTRRFRSMQL